MSYYSKNHKDFLSQEITQDAYIDEEAGFFDTAIAGYDEQANYSRELDLTKEFHDKNYNYLKEQLDTSDKTDRVLNLYKDTFSKIKIEELEELRSVIESGDEETYVNSFLSGTRGRDDFNFEYKEAKRRVEAIKTFDKLKEAYGQEFLGTDEIKQKAKEKYYKKKQENEILFENAGWFDQYVGQFTGAMAGDITLAGKRLVDEGNPIHAGSYLIGVGAGKAGLSLLQNLGRRSGEGFVSNFAAEGIIQATEEMNFQQKFLDNKDYGADDVLINATIGGLFGAAFAGTVGGIGDLSKRRLRSDSFLEQSIDDSFDPLRIDAEQRGQEYYQQNADKTDLDAFENNLKTNFNNVKKSINHIYDIGKSEYDAKINKIDQDAERAQQRLNESNNVIQERLAVHQIKEEIDFQESALLEKDIQKQQSFRQAVRENDFIIEDHISKTSMDKIDKELNSLTKNIGRLNKEQTKLKKNIEGVNKKIKSKDIKELELNPLLKETYNTNIRDRAQNAKTLKELQAKQKRLKEFKEQVLINFENKKGNIEKSINDLKKAEQERINSIKEEQKLNNKVYKEVKAISEIFIEDYSKKLDQLKSVVNPEEFKKQYTNILNAIKKKETEIYSVLGKINHKVNLRIKDFDNAKKKYETEALINFPKKNNTSNKLNANQKAWVNNKLHNQFGTDNKNKYRKQVESEIKQESGDNETILFRDLDKLTAELKKLKIAKKQESILEAIDNGVLKNFDEYKKLKLNDEEIYNKIKRDIKTYQQSINELNFKDGIEMDEYSEILKYMDNGLRDGSIPATPDNLRARRILTQFKSKEEMLDNVNNFDLTIAERKTEVQNQVELHNKQVKADAEHQKNIDWVIENNELFNKGLINRIKNYAKGNVKEKQDLYNLTVDGKKFIEDPINQITVNQLIDSGYTYAEIFNKIQERITEWNNGKLQEKIQRKKEALEIKRIDGAEKIVKSIDNTAYEIDNETKSVYNNIIEDSNSAFDQLPQEIKDLKFEQTESVIENGVEVNKTQELSIKDQVAKTNKELDEIKKAMECMI